jgi:hypothetical protein
VVAGAVAVHVPVQVEVQRALLPHRAVLVTFTLQDGSTESYALHWSGAQSLAAMLTKHAGIVKRKEQGSRQ